MKKELIAYPDFDKLDIRVGEVKDAKTVEGSTKLLELTVDMGEEYGTVTILTGMAQFYAPEDFINKKFQFIANLEPRKMMGKESQGMLLSADDNNRPILIEVSSSIANGLIVR